MSVIDELQPFLGEAKNSFGGYPFEVLASDGLTLTGEERYVCATNGIVFAGVRSDEPLGDLPEEVDHRAIAFFRAQAVRSRAFASTPLGSLRDFTAKIASVWCTCRGCLNRPVSALVMGVRLNMRRFAPLLDFIGPVDHARFSTTIGAKSLELFDSIHTEPGTMILSTPANRDGVLDRFISLMPLQGTRDARDGIPCWPNASHVAAHSAVITDVHVEAVH